MGALTTHVLDTAQGTPAADIEVTLSVRGEAGTDSGWRDLATRRTDSDGRISDLLPDVPTPEAGVYRLRFRLDEYHAKLPGGGFYPYADVVFRLTETDDHYHVPLLLSPFGYSTYRGS